VAEFATLQDIVLAAKRKLSPTNWDYLTGGSDSETTLKRNRAALDSIAFRPRVFRDVSQADASSEYLGQKFSIPVFMAPIGSLVLLDPGGALSVAKAAAKSEVMSMVSTVSMPGIEPTAEGSDCYLVFQLYVRGDMDWVDGIMDRVKAADYKAVAITVDTASYSRRERDLVNRLVKREPGKWAALGGIDPLRERHHQAKLTWDLIARVKDRTHLPVIVKGIATPEDAKLALEHGADVIYVSNHGGRQLDHGLGSIQVLPEIVEAVGGKAEVFVDGGFVRGSDVLKAIALGATAVGIAKLQGWALAAGGEAGLARAIEIIHEEIRVCMMLLGITSLDELDGGYLHPTQPVTQPHPLSAFPLFMEKHKW
jgi:glycolate oxidase